jgi:hypothetical protein
MCNCSPILLQQEAELTVEEVKEAILYEPFYTLEYLLGGQPRCFLKAAEKAGMLLYPI